MKKVLKKLSFIAIVMFMTSVVMTSCKKEPIREQCEIDNVGTVDVFNDTGWPGEVDVTWGTATENYEKYLYDGGSYLYTNVEAGSIEIWISLDLGGGVWTDWVYNVENLSACEAMQYTWFLSSTKSSEPMPLLDLGNGKIGVPTRKVKH